LTDRMKEIFEQNKQILGDMDKAVYYFREQQYEKGLKLAVNTIDQVKAVIEALIAEREYFNLVTTEALLEMLERILDAKKDGDYLLLADLLELQLISFLVGVQELIISKEEILFNDVSYRENILLLKERGTDFPQELLDPVNTTELMESGYRVEFTSCGQMTLAAENLNKKFYFHTNNKVRSEAFLLAKSWYKADTTRYIIYGFGMGYHINELLLLTDEEVIEVYEADLNVMQLACAFTEIKDILTNQRIKVIYDPNFQKIQKRITEQTAGDTYLLHYPSYKNVRVMQGKEWLDGAFPWAKKMNAY